jgi:hypothetical protein
VFFLFLFFCSHLSQARSEAKEDAKSGIVLFQDAIQCISSLEECMPLFEKAAAKGHAEAIWVLRVLKKVKLNKADMKEAFANTEEPLGWFFAAELSDPMSRERFEFYKKSAEAGCGWGQFDYGCYFQRVGRFVEKDLDVHKEWLEKAAAQDHRWALYDLSCLVEDAEKRAAYLQRAAELGHEDAVDTMDEMAEVEHAKDLIQKLRWNAKIDGGYDLFWDQLQSSTLAILSGKMESNFNEVCYTLGWGLYWYLYGDDHWDMLGKHDQVFGNRCLDYYCSCVELQQKSIFTFLWFWNRTTGVKGPGQMIAQMVWEQQADNLVKLLSEKVAEAKEPETKRIKK